jgi:CDP-diacylglycerol--glycerol-3-phosphate 3-phosphatidyltransferase
MEKRLSEASAFNPANLLTLLRLVLVPVFAVYLLERRWPLVFAVFALAAVTDFLDGWVARRFGWVTSLGVFIDPMADKALQLTAFTLLAVRDICPDWVAILAWAREIIVVSGFTLLALLTHVSHVKVTRLGKAGTFAQMTALGLLLAARAFWRNPLVEPVAVLALGLAVLLNFVAGLEYVLRGLKAYEGGPPAAGPGSGSAG